MVAAIENEHEEVYIDIYIYIYIYTHRERDMQGEKWLPLTIFTECMSLARSHLFVI